MFLILLSIVGVVVVIATVTVTQERLSRTCKGGREAASLRASRFPLRIASICVEIRLGEPKGREPQRHPEREATSHKAHSSARTS